MGILVVFMTGCAGQPSPEAIAANDPFEVTNRHIMKMNTKIGKYVLGPVVGGYFFVVPKGLRKLINNVVENSMLPIVFINDLLQGEPKRAGQTIARLAVDSTLGLGGLFDPASTHFHIPVHSEDFGQTLAVWGVGEGPYLVLPVLGPDTPRDLVGQVADIFMDPVHYVVFKQNFWWDIGRSTLVLVDLRERTYVSMKEVERNSVDYYTAMRSIYRQSRNNEIRNGRPPKGIQALSEF
jgi:phospholipid-binding lipoprotein MlaA